jgi:hypothetical protein
MSLPKAAEATRKEIVRLTHAGLDSATLRRAVAARLRRVVPTEAYGFATLDPATMLLTGSVRANIPTPPSPCWPAMSTRKTTTSSSPNWRAGRCRSAG